MRAQFNKEIFFHYYVLIRMKNNNNFYYVLEHIFTFHQVRLQTKVSLGLIKKHKTKITNRATVYGAQFILFNTINMSSLKWKPTAYKQINN